jgi:hypothetical protein
MATQQQQQRHWYNDREIFLHGFVRSNYVTAFTDWFMGLAGKATEIVLYATVLYSCAQLYPHVNVPNGLSLAVFLIQMGALDIGGLSLGKLAKQAREDGNQVGATNANTLSKWLIGIMLVGVVTVGLEHALPVALPSWVTVSIDVLLVVARSICAVLYGRVVHSLKSESVVPSVPALRELFSAELTERIERITALAENKLTEQVKAITATAENKLSEMHQQFTRELTSLVEQAVAERPVLATLTETMEAHSTALAQLTTFPGLVERQSHSLKQALQELRISIESSTSSKPKLSLVQPEKVSESEGKLTNKEFIEAYLSKHTDARNVDIIAEASKHGLTISQSQVSQIRKAFEERSA